MQEAILRRSEGRGISGRHGSRAVVVVTLLLLAGCARQDPRLESMIEMEASPLPPDAARIRELRATIAENEAVVASALRAAMRQADLTKLLAQEYLRSGLFGPALDALEQAIILQPQNHVLHQLAGVSAAHLGKAQARPQAREAYFRLAESHYRHSISLSGDYTEARYGLAVLYVFETGEPLAALPHLEHIISRDRSHTQALFVLARAHVELGNITDALAAYERIMETAADRDARARAARNRALLTGAQP